MAANGNGEKSRHYATFVLFLLASIAIMVMYVEAMAFPSLQKVMRDFGLNASDYALASWIVTIYLVVGCVTIPIFGKLGDIYGKKKMLLIAMIIYSIMVTTTGFSRDISNSIYVMIALRGIQGMAMCMFPLAFSIIRDEFPRDKMAVAQGIISAMFGVGTAIGFVVGGEVTDRLGWQWTYHTVAPFAFIATAIVAWKVRESPVRLNVKVDYVGAAILGGALITFLVGVTEAENQGWTDPLILTLLVTSGILAVTFWSWLGRSDHPLIRPSLLKQRDIALTSVIAFIIGFGIFATYQTIASIGSFNFQLDATQIGLLLLPTSAVNLVCGPIVGLLVRKHGPKWPTIIGMSVAIVGFALLFMMHGTQLDIAMWVAVMGAGQSFAMVGSINMIVISTPPVETAISTSMNTIFRTAGSVAGPALTAVIISTNSHIDPARAYLGPIPDDIAYKMIFLMAMAVVAVGVFVGIFLTNKKFVGEGLSVPQGARTTQTSVEASAPTEK